MNLAIFDLDNTLLAGDSDFQWGQFLIEQGLLKREEHEAKNIEFYEDYKPRCCGAGRSPRGSASASS